MIPEDLKHHLSKIDGHLNAADRKLWYETERGVWSAHQAIARLAEVWLWLDGACADLPPLERYLPRDVMAARIEAFGAALGSDAAAAAWMEVSAAEAAVRAKPFSHPGKLSREVLHAEIARQRRYVEALRALERTVENRIAGRYVPLHSGDWVLLGDGTPGRLIALDGLTAHVFLPWSAGHDPSGAVRMYSLEYTSIRSIERPPSAPIGVPAYYFLRHANRLWWEAREFAHADWAAPSGFMATLLAVMDAAAKAWWVTFEPNSRMVSWSHASPQHVTLLKGRVPPAVDAPLAEALRRADVQQNDVIKAGRRASPVWRDQADGMLELVRRAVVELEAILAPEVDLAEGDWLEIPYRGCGPVVRRHGTRVAVDLRRKGIVDAALFHDALRRIAPPRGARAAGGRQHARWLWFVRHPAACRGRDVCPCCGLPGIENAGGMCRLCGWVHDLGDFHPGRPSERHDGLNLALGRYRFESLGYAVPWLNDSPRTRAAWLDPCVLARKRVLVQALDDLCHRDAGEDSPTLEKIDALWHAYGMLLTERMKEGAFAQ